MKERYSLTPSQKQSRTKKLIGFYGKEAVSTDFAKHYAKQPFQRQAKKFMSRVLKGGMRVLDVGCGTGHLTSGLPDSIEVVGVDITPEMVEKAKEARPGARYFVHDFHKPIPSNAGHFDVVIANGCFDLSYDIEKALCAMSLTLKKTGLLYFNVLERRVGVAYHDKREMQASVMLNLWTFQEVSHVLELAGLFPVSYYYGTGWKSRSLGCDFNYGYWVVSAVG